MSDVGEQACFEMGLKMNQMGLKFDKILCSGLKRAILSAKLVRKGYTSHSDIQKEHPSIHLFIRAHEFRAVHEKGQIMGGLTREQVQEIIPDIKIAEDQKINEKGWNFMETLETNEDLVERIKLFIKDLKDMHRQDPHQTVLLISHGHFLGIMLLMLT